MDRSQFHEGQRVSNGHETGVVIELTPFDDLYVAVLLMDRDNEKVAITGEHWHEV